MGDWRDLRRASKKLTLGKGHVSMDHYAVSKLAQILFTLELARRDPQIHAVAVHPGDVATNIWPWPLRGWVTDGMLTLEEGSRTVLYAAHTAPTMAAECASRYLTKCDCRRPSPSASNESLQHQMWDL